MKSLTILAYPERNSFLCRVIYKHLFIVKSSKKKLSWEKAKQMIRLYSQKRTKIGLL